MRALLVAGVLAACVDPAPPIEPMVTSHTMEMEFVPWSINRVDILFVIDSSTAMAPHRAHLDAKLPLLMDAFGPLPLNVPDVHIGVITANDDGRMIPRGSMSGAFLTDEPQLDGTRTKNYAGTLAQAFGAYAAVGAQSTLPARPFEAVQRALEPTMNPGFLRPNTYLAVIYVAATDDASAVDVATHVAELKTRFSDPTLVSVTTISGPPTGTSPCGAGAAPRLHALIDAFPYRGGRVSICDDDLTPAIQLARQMQNLLQLFCWQRVPIEPHECSAYLSLDVYGEETMTTVPACTSVEPTSPCWRIVDEPECQGFGAVPLTTRLEPRNIQLSSGTRGWIECVVGGPSGENP